MSQAQVSRLLGQTAHFSLLLNIFQSVAQASTMDTIQYNFKTRVQKSVKKICTLFLFNARDALEGRLCKSLIFYISLYNSILFIHSLSINVSFSIYGLYIY